MLRMVRIAIYSIAAGLTSYNIYSQVKEVKQQRLQTNNVKNDVDEHQDENDVTSGVRSFAPIIVGAGRGTTGTHLMAQTTCFLGYPSFHYFVGCAHLLHKIDSIGGGNVTIIPEKYQKLYELDAQLLHKFMELSRCILKPCAAISIRNQITENLHDFVSYIRMHLTDMESDDSIYIALHDTPWPFLMSGLIKEVKEQYNGLSPIIILSTRDPIHYVKRRIETRHATRDVMCKNHTISASSLQENAFDIIGCLNKTLNGLSGEEANKIMISDVFTTMKLISENDAVDAVKSYQDIIGGMANFSFDMFIQEGRIAKEDLALEMSSKAKILKAGEPCDYVNWRKRIPINILL